MSRPAHFLDPYRFQIEEMAKLGCTDEHICRVLEDITGKEVKKRVIANKRMWLRKMENKRKQYEPYKGEIKYMIEYGLTIQNIYAAISEESGIDASIETFKNFLKDNDMMPESKRQEASVKDIFGNIANYMEFHEGLSADQLPAQQSGIKSKQGIDAELFTVAMKKKKEKPKKNGVYICSSCGREIIGDYEYIKTKRGTELYFCKDMRCRRND